jgi:hypothetical protein
VCSRITIKVLSAVNLPAKDLNGSSDPFVKATAGKATAKSKKFLKTLEPVWNETLTLEHVDVHDLESKTLLLEVWDWDRLTRNDLIGSTSVDLATFDCHAAQAKRFEVTLEGARTAKLLFELKVEREMAARDAARISHQLTSRLKAQALQFCDPDFPLDNRSLFDDTALHTINHDDKGRHTSKFAWNRLSLLTPKPALFVDGTGANDIIQGALGSCYLLSALAVLATRKDLVSALFVTANVALGLFQVRFFKNEWLVVTIDDNVPMGGNKLPVYARCSELREMWVPLVEKAYAKLHGTYESIETGSIASALIDLTGEAPESVNLVDSRADLNALWSKLLHATAEGYLMGASAAAVANAKNGVVEEDLGNGLLGNHAYAVLTAVEVGAHRLVNLRNPWGGSKEWTGAWSDSSKEWTQFPDVAKKLKHTAAADGVFWMTLADFAGVFTNLWILRLLCDSKGHKHHRYEHHGKWSGRSAGGSVNNATFGENPQIGVTAKFNNTTLSIALLQPDKRLTRAAEYKSAIGLSLFKAPPSKGKDDRFHRLYDVSKIDKTIPYAPERSVVVDFGPMKAGERVAIVPALFDAGVEQSYTMLVFASNQVEFGELEGPDPISLSGEWTSKNAGGCVNHDSWSTNPVFTLKSDIACAVTIKLQQAERDELYHIGVSLGKGAKPNKSAIEHDETCVNSLSVAFERTLEPGVTYWVMPQTFNPDCHGKFTIQAFKHNEKAVVSFA